MKTIFVLTHVAMSVAEALWASIPQSTSEVLFLVGLFFTGALASFTNMLSGGGSMIVLGFMMLLGVDPATANGTNRVGVLVSTATGAAAYRSENYTDIRESLKLGLWSIPGAIAGAFFSVRISGALYEKLLAIVMIAVVVSMFLPKRSTKKKDAPGKGKWMYPAMLLVGFYGGAVQVGVGIFIYAALRHLGNMPLMRVNMHRVFIVLIFIVPVMAVFIWSGKINWAYAVVLCIGNAVGSWVTVKWTLKKGDKMIKIGLAASVVLMSMKFLVF
ncbi:MAG: sulfite exporter TauE/SafE family protein [Deltaproteobacteria bacterium]|nr:sulfite exporter TauE/SafE family protein [Deltaproteobacteria bacterium]MBN2673266.1 sulfite exporter TauE/SafE family protein [Deltaproteobacteria bacterium]